MAVSRIVSFLLLCVLCHSMHIETPNYSLNEYKSFLDKIWDVVNTIGEDTPDLNIRKKTDKTGTIDLEFTTPNDFKYHFFPVLGTSIDLEVKAGSDVHIAFSTSPFEKNPVELIIGGSNNTISQFRRGQKIEEEVSTPDILDQEKFREFLLRWGDGVILVWRAGEHRPFISWVPCADTTIGYLGVRTGAGVTGSWKIQDLSVKRTRNNSVNQTATINFKVKAANDAHIGFFDTPAFSRGQMIEIVIGGWSNTKSAIRRGNYKLNDQAVVEIPGLLNASEYRGFWVQWGKIISVGREGETCPFLSWPDPNPFHETYLGLHTGYGAIGSWKIEDWEEILTPDKIEYLFRPFTAYPVSDSSSTAIDSW